MKFSCVAKKVLSGLMDQLGQDPGSGDSWEISVRRDHRMFRSFGGGNPDTKSSRPKPETD